MDKKILAVDLDDTLFTTEKTISEENILALEKLLDAGHILAVDTGRPLYMMKQLLYVYDLFKRPNVYLLGFQGAQAYETYTDKILYTNYVDKAAALKLIDQIKDFGLTALLFCPNAIYAFENNETVDYYNTHVVEPITVLDSTADIEDIDICKVMAVDFKNIDKLEEFRLKYLDETSEYFTEMYSNIAFLEYVKKGCSKGNGLKQLAEYLGISMENTIACGDERNDISMIKIAGTGVAVANARAEAKEVADYITQADHNHGAIAEAINKFIL